jgi:hypothetical protein
VLEHQFFKRKFLKHSSDETKILAVFLLLRNPLRFFHFELVPAFLNLARHGLSQRKFVSLFGIADYPHAV